MPTVQTIRRPPPIKEAQLTKVMEFWELETQGQSPLFEEDTTAGPIVETLPFPGANQATGQTNQNAEYSYIKISADAHTVTINGGASGPVVLTALNQVARFKSNGNLWRRII
jgi:hypothetical protein